MKIVVFGASGFVGGWICELLHEQGAVDLLACVRRWSGACRLARRGIEIMQVDLESRNNLASLLAGADAVINASVPSSNLEPELAVKLYQACAQAGVKRYVQFSSAALYGDLTGSSIDEDMPPVPADDYGRGKAEMERRLLAAAGEAGPQLFILRPSIIYGQFSDSWTVRFAHRIVNGRLRSFGPLGEGTCNLVHARDAARAAILCATTSASHGSHVLNINGPDVVSWNDYIARFGDALEISDRVQFHYLRLVLMVYGTELVRAVGKWLLKHFQRIIRTMTQSGQAGPAVMASAKSLANFYPTIAETRLLRRKAFYNSDRAVRVLGFRAEIPLDEGLKQSASWCRTHGVV